MSIFNDKNLRQILEAEGSKFLNKFGQATDEALTYQIAKPLLVQLQRQVDPENAPKQSLLGTSSGELPELKATYLTNIETFLSWCSYNKITWNGKPIAYDITDTSAPEDSVEYGNSKVSPKELANFLTYLRDSDEARGNKMFSSMLSKIITKANESLENPIDVRPSPKSIGGKSKDGKPIDGSKSSEVSSGNISKVINTLPLVLWTYNFPKIKLFLDEMNTIMPDATAALSAQIETHNGAANANLNPGTQNQIMYLQNAETVAAFTVNPKQAVITYLDHIQTVIKLVQGLILTFAQTQDLTPAERAKVNEQIDPSRGIAYQNINQIQKIIEQTKKNK